MSDSDMSGRICLVTGATSGIGKVTAQALAAQGATVIIVGRNPQKTADTVREIIEQTGNSAVEYLLADLSVQAKIRQLAAEFKSRYPRLDVLINNAGGIFPKRRETSDGIEMTLALNYLTPFLLTNLLLDALQASPAARIVNVSALAHEWGKLNFEDLQSQRGYKWRGWAAYNQAKLANVMFTYELARRLKNTNVTANVLHPGIIATNFGSDIVGGRLGKILKAVFFDSFVMSPERGAQTTIYLATSPEVTQTSGQYFQKSRPSKSSKASYDEATAAQLWQVSGELTGLNVPSIVPAHTKN